MVAFNRLCVKSYDLQVRVLRKLDILLLLEVKVGIYQVTTFTCRMWGTMRERFAAICKRKPTASIHTVVKHFNKIFYSCLL
jgi:hypothetical protein